MRNFDEESRDNEGRQYAYDFDWIIRSYLLKALEKHFDLKKSALELGCYQGDMTAQILQYFPMITVVEAAEELAAHVSKRFENKVQVINATFEDATVAQSFHNIFLVHTLEHLDEPVAVLGKIKTWLGQNGRLFVAVPNANALSRQIAVRMGLVQYNAAVTPAEEKHGHRRTYSMDLLQHHLRSAGLRVIESGGILVKPLANFQFDKALKANIIDDAYLDACFELGKLYPDLCASLYAVCEAD